MGLKEIGPTQATLMMDSCVYFSGSKSKIENVKKEQFKKKVSTSDS